MTAMMKERGRSVRVREKRLRRAAISLYCCAAMSALHTAVAVMLAAPEKRTPLAVIGGVLLNAVAIVLLVWVGRGVRHGKRLAVAAGLVTFLAIGALMAAVAALLTRYTGAKGLLTVQILYLVIIVFAFFSVVSASLARNSVAFGSDEW